MEVSSENPKLLMYKWASFVSILIISFLFAALPVLWKRFRNSDLLLGLANSFSGGLFLSVGIMHILPESAAEFQDGFPWPFFAAIMTYSQILLIDKVIFSSTGQETVAEQQKAVSVKTKTSMIIKKNSDDCNNHGKESIDFDNKNPIDININKENLAIEQLNISNESQQELNENYQFPGKDNKGQFENIRSKSAKINDKPDLGFNNNVKEKQIPLEDELSYNATNLGNNKLTSDLVNEQLIQRLDHSNEPEYTPKFIIGPYLLVAAMGIHATFEGLSLGIAKDYEDFWTMFLCIFCHKWAESMTIGISFAKNLKDIGTKKSMKFIFLFSIFTPIGIFQGILLSSDNKKFTATVNGLCAGTFIYIAASEIIIEEFNRDKHAWWKFFFYILGVAQMCVAFAIERAYD